jgi:hypothetical protein
VACATNGDWVREDGRTIVTPRSLGPLPFHPPKDQRRDAPLANGQEVGVERSLPSYTDTTVGVVVLGSPEACWRCGAVTTNVLGIAPVGSTDPCDMLPFTDDAVKELVVAVLDDEARDQAGVGRICARWSKTTGFVYVSNGCRRCDALQGDHFVMESVAAIDPESIMDLVPVAETELPASSWAELLRTCVGG